MTGSALQSLAYVHGQARNTPQVRGEFGIDSELVDDVLAIAVGEDVGQYSASNLANQLDRAIDQGHRDLVVELSEMTFLGIAGITVLVEAVRRMTAVGGQITVHSPSPFMRRLLSSTGLAQLAGKQEGCMTTGNLDVNDHQLLANSPRLAVPLECTGISVNLTSNSGVSVLR